MSANFVNVRKGKGRVHLAVRHAPGERVETLCDKHFESGEIEAVEMDADCQACVRRQSDPGRVSSAFFEGGRGSALLELSLQQARERRQVVTERRQVATERRAAGDLERDEAPRAGAVRLPHLTIVPSERPERHRRAAPVEASATSDQRSTPAEPEPAGLERGVYRTPAGVLIRVGGQTERPRLERRRGDRVRVVAGDVELDIPPLAE